MKKAMSFIPLILISLMTAICSGEKTDIKESPKSTSSIIGGFPIKMIRNKVILPVRVNDSKELEIILDTGMPFDGLYLFHKELKGELALEGVKEVQVPGAGSGEASTAIQSDSARLSFGDIEIMTESVIISQSATTQWFGADGVLGYTLFGRYAIEIDYDEMVINLHDTTKIDPDSTWEKVEITLPKGIPFLEASVAVTGDSLIPVTLYIDLASSDALEMLVKSDMKFELPENCTETYLGTGLSGDIYGKTGRISIFKLGSFELHDLPGAFAPAEVRSRQEGADGILANNALRRFNVIFDYSHETMYIKPNSYFPRPFEQ
ncbi:MAG: hypothetical protein GY839_15890 [candidate division Zixibacteria bacterium]|nr:hypothetical protein [candidate division Zixibacteria bacterium]